MGNTQRIPQYFEELILTMTKQQIAFWVFSVALSTTGQAQELCQINALHVDKELDCSSQNSCENLHSFGYKMDKYGGYRRHAFYPQLGKEELNKVSKGWLYGNTVRQDSSGKSYTSSWGNLVWMISGQKRDHVTVFLYHNTLDESRPKGTIFVALDTRNSSVLAELKMPEAFTDRVKDVSGLRIAISADYKKVIIDTGMMTIIDIQKKTVEVVNFQATDIVDDKVYGSVKINQDAKSNPAVLDLRSSKMSYLNGDISRESGLNYIWPKANLLTSGSRTYTLKEGQLLDASYTSSLISTDGSNLILKIDGYLEKPRQVFQVSLKDICEPVAKINSELRDKKIIFNEKTCQFEGAAQTTSAMINDLIKKATTNTLSVHSITDYSTLMKSEFSKYFPNLRSYLMILSSLDEPLDGIFNLENSSGQRLSFVLSYNSKAESIACLGHLAVDRELHLLKAAEIFGDGKKGLSGAKPFLEAMDPMLKSRIIDAVSEYDYDENEK